MKSPALDRLDLRIVSELQADARLAHAELGRRVGLSGTAAGDRVRRLEERGVIRGYRAEIDPRHLGLPIAAVLRIRPTLGQLRKVAEAAQKTPEVVECHRITGEDCFLMKMHLSSIDDMERVIDRFTPYGQTTTSIVQSSPVPWRAVQPPSQ